MIPFPKRKSSVSDEIESVDIDVSFDVVDDNSELELTDEDFILLEAAPPPAPISRSILRAALAAVPSENVRTVLSEPVRVARRFSPSTRLSWDVEAESNVADECLASIAAEASRSRAFDPFFSIAESGLQSVRSPKLPPASSPPRSAMISPPSSSSTVALSPRLPPVSSPPFIRTSLVPYRSPLAPSVSGHVNDVDSADVLETIPVPTKTPFARTTTDTASAPTPSASSVAPVALPSKSEATVVVLRDRPRTAWIIAAAAVGALVAISAMRFFAPSSSSSATAVEPPAPQPSAIVAPPPERGAVVRFSEADGVSIKLPAPGQASAPPAGAARAPAPVVTAPATHSAHPPPHAPAVHGSAGHVTHAPTPHVSPPTPLPDGSLGLANNNGKASASSYNTPAPLPVPAARKHPLTPEQELAEAQLRAASTR